MKSESETLDSVLLDFRRHYEHCVQCKRMFVAFTPHDPEGTVEVKLEICDRGREILMHIFD